MALKLNGTNSVAAPAYAGDDADTGLQCGTNELKLVTGGSARATVDSSGRLLLGTTTARADLTVAKGNGSIPAAGASTGAAVFSNGTDDAVYGVVVGANTSGTGYIQSQRTDGNATTYSLAIQPNGGNVGIGTTAPLKQLQVGAYGSSSEGTIALASTTSGPCSILMGDGATGSDFYRGYVQYSNADDAMLFATSASERMRILSGGGLTFNGDTAQANALDDYEEGTWTPTLTGSSSAPSLTYNTRLGEYVKIGSVVHLSFFIQVANVSAQGGGQLRITGLPFSSKNSTGAGEVPGVLLQSEPFTSGDGANRYQMIRTAPNQAQFYVLYKDLTTGQTHIDNTGAAQIGTNYMIGSCTYRTN